VLIKRLFFFGGKMKSKSILTAVIIIAIAVFVVAAVSTVITGPSDHYQRPEVGLEQKLAETEPKEPTTQEQNTLDDMDTAEPATEMSEEASSVLEQEQQALESSTEVMVDATTELVNIATEEALKSSKDATDRANKAIEEAQKMAEEGREEAEEILEQVTTEAEAVVEEVAAPPASAQTHTVTAQGLVFNPLVVTIAPGDTVSWTNMSTHNVESIEGLIPEGAEMFLSDMSQNYSRTFTQEGIYVYKCTPHFGTGMGGVIIVGEPVNLEELKAMQVAGATRRLVNRGIQAAEAM
jgi:pseudoazurin